MSRLQNAVQQLKPKNQPTPNNTNRALGLLSLNEGFTIPIANDKDVDKFTTTQDKNSLKKLVKYLNTLKITDIAIAGGDGGNDSN